VTALAGTRHAAVVAVLLLALGSMPLAAADFVGAQACADCHQAEYQAWQRSHHYLAMAHAGPDTVRGDFNNARYVADGVESSFTLREGRYFVTTEGADGQQAEFEVLYTFGIEPLQQYLVRFPDGRLQALRQSWDTRPAEQGGQRWFHQYPDEHISHEDELHWTGLQQNWNYMCADCHSTNLDKGYDPATDRFDTTFSDINVACEACHGPGEKHLEWAARTPELQAADVNKGLAVLLHDRRGVSWPINPDTGIAERRSAASSGVELQVCATCHSRRGTLKPGAARNPVFLDHHMPALLTEALYHDDGQILDEVFVWGSFTQSKMHAAGVTCSNCHDPHSQQLYAPGEQVCAQCHLSSTFASENHHGHPQDSSGADCLGCHMPTQTYMVVDPRRDHSLRSPRPDLSLEFGTPNACTQCHSDRDDAWAAEAFAEMFPRASEPFQHWTRAFQQARSGMPQAEVSLIKVISDRNTPDIARATAVLELRAYLSPLSGQVLERALHDSSPLVRIAALGTLDALPPANRYALAGHLLSDPLLAVRVEAARVLAQTPLNQLDVQQRGNLQLALKDYYDSQQYNADRPESRVNLGNLQARAGNATEAEKYYRQAIKLGPLFSPAYVNLADLYRDQGMPAEAENVLRQGLAEAAEDATLFHSLGLAQIRSGQAEPALESLARASDLAPHNARFAYVYGVALNSTGAQDEAVKYLADAQQRFPYNREILFALATMERDRGNREAAEKWARRLLEINPADSSATQLLQQLQGQAG
jgi:tetratricopeptide (TPR) repeat protein